MVSHLQRESLNSTALKSHKILLRKFKNTLAVNLKMMPFLICKLFLEKVGGFLSQLSVCEVGRKLYFQSHTMYFHSGKDTVIWLPSASTGKLKSPCRAVYIFFVLVKSLFP